ncbi:BnaC05g08290D [Brassica napus]|uniref:(rape) hypothetical protein n=1 Tax=Brassica napus TaxID=3708 RepID=A0A078FY42_BRANA|nr:unnamed protein product [Brassica napus]CDY19320.1 BnaC05g08290D [Brassica napus]
MTQTNNGLSTADTAPVHTRDLAIGTKKNELHAP